MNMNASPAALFLLSVFLRCSCFGQLPADANANLLKKPAFDKGSWDVKFFGNAGKVTKDSTELHDGHPSLRIDQTTPAGVAFLNQKVPVKPATRYRFSGWIKATRMVLPKEQQGQKSGAALAVFPGLGNSGWISDTADWVHASVDFTTKATQTEVQLGPRVGFNQWRPIGTAWFADISLVELGPARTAPR